MTFPPPLPIFNENLPSGWFGIGRSSQKRDVSALSLIDPRRGFPSSPFFLFCPMLAASSVTSRCPFPTTFLNRKRAVGLPRAMIKLSFSPFEAFFFPVFLRRTDRLISSIFPDLSQGELCGPVRHQTPTPPLFSPPPPGLINHDSFVSQQPF